MAPSPSSALPPGAACGGCTSIHFGENQLSPRSIGISPLSTAPPPVLQHWWVRASTKCHLRFTLAMDSSRGFGSHRRHRARRAVHTRFPSGCPALALVNHDLRRLLLPAAGRTGQATTMHSPDHSTKGTPSALASPWDEWPLAACKYAVSGSLSSPLRGAFHLSLTVLVHYRSLKVLSLGGWSPLLPTNSPGFVVLRMPTQPRSRAATGLSPALVRRSSLFASGRPAVLIGPTTPGLRANTWFGLLPVRSPLLGESRLISSRQATEMFQFACCPPPALCIQAAVSGHHARWVAPFGFSRLFARMQLPLNVSPVSASFIGLQRQGIHRVLCAACDPSTRWARLARHLLLLPSAKLK